MHVCMYACMHVCMYACMHVFMYACMHVCMCACVRVCVCACVRVCVHACMCTYIYVICRLYVYKAVCLVLAATKPSRLVQIALALSLYTNAAKVLDTGSLREGTLGAVHGIRFLSMTWVMLGHIYVFGIRFFSKLPTVTQFY